MSRVFGLTVDAQQQYAQDGTYDVYATPFESDGDYGTAEFNVYMYDHDTGSWAQGDLQLITHDGAPTEYNDAASSWNESLAFYNCGRSSERHAAVRFADFFAPAAAAQSWNNIRCNNDYELSMQLLRTTRNGVGVGVATAFGSWAGRLCRWSGPGFWGCVGTNGWAAGSAYILYEFGSFVYTCRCRYAGGTVGMACV